MGAQGAGKGTQAERLAPALNLYHLSTGEAFRTAISAETELGVLAKGYIDRGDLVPDDITLAIVAARLDEISSDAGPDGKSGALFDGFPRTVPQAEALSALLERIGAPLDAVVQIDVPRELLVKRATGRRTDLRTGQIYHLEYNPPPPGAQLEHLSRFKPFVLT